MNTTVRGLLLALGISFIAGCHEKPGTPAESPTPSPATSPEMIPPTATPDETPVSRCDGIDELTKTYDMRDLASPILVRLSQIRRPDDGRGNPRVRVLLELIDAKKRRRSVPLLDDVGDEAMLWVGDPPVLLGCENSWAGQSDRIELVEGSGGLLAQDTQDEDEGGGGPACSVSAWIRLARGAKVKANRP